MNRGEIIEEIFEIIKDLGVLLPRFESKHEHLRRIRRATYYGAIRRLEDQGLVKKIGK